ncbi:hypothetical protein P154DRAFT_612634 [Amniculicola lignicola CBS 123094]|uniref:Apple domain-containing protein n=1 Tax=Amniculicola lignicola CBS 123094 TaxID=1392246 RepID=A0A6A5W6W8_9PLEO|nr:hypothetical protein P154DRAFT_612634 [Amniculicola lignicola CBS 123094]
MLLTNMFSKTYLIILALLPFFVGATYTDVTCLTASGSKSVHPIKTITRTTTLNVPPKVTYTVRRTTKTITPIPKTRTTTSTLTKISTVTDTTITDVFSTTLSATLTLTDFTTETTTATSVSEVTFVSTSTSTVSAPPGFLYAEDTINGYPALKRGLDRVRGGSFSSPNPAQAKDVALVARGGKKHPTPPKQYATAVSCIKAVKVQSTRTVTISGCPSTTVLPRQTITKACTRTITTKTTILPPNVKTTLTFSTTVTTNLLSTITESTSTVSTTTLTVPGPTQTAYEACSSRNILIRTPDGQEIFTLNFATNPTEETVATIGGISSPTDCCKACFALGSQCAHAFWVPELGGCRIGRTTAGTCPSQSGLRLTYGTNQQHFDTPWIVMNGWCGYWQRL